MGTLPFVAPLQLEGLYANSVYVLNHCAFGGVKAASTVCARAFHFDLGVKLAVFRRR